MATWAGGHAVNQPPLNMAPPSLHDMQPLIEIEVYSREDRHLDIVATGQLYHVHQNFLCYYATNLPQGYHGVSPRSGSPLLQIEFSLPSVFGRFLVWAYQRTLLEGDKDVAMQSIHQGEWVNLWLLADLLGAPRLQNDIILCLEEYRARDLFKPLKGSFLRQIYVATKEDSALRRYLVDTWDNSSQNADAKDYPPALLVDLVNAQQRAKVKTESGFVQLDPRKYFVDDRVQAHIPFLFYLPEEGQAQDEALEYRTGRKRALTNDETVAGPPTKKKKKKDKHQTVVMKSEEVDSTLIGPAPRTDGRHNAQPLNRNNNDNIQGGKKSGRGKGRGGGNQPKKGKKKGKGNGPQN